MYDNARLNWMRSDTQLYLADVFRISVKQGVLDYLCP